MALERYRVLLISQTLSSINGWLKEIYTTHSIRDIETFRHVTVMEVSIKVEMNFILTFFDALPDAHLRYTLL
jgi:hypothetical protein